MKLLKTLFSVLETSTNRAGFFTTIKLNPDHIVYKGHFPGHPVTPGVIQMQIVHELLENHLNRNLKLLTMSQCKFLKILNPNKTSQIVIHIKFANIDEVLNIKVEGRNGKDVFFKLNAVYQFA